MSQAECLQSPSLCKCFKRTTRADALDCASPVSGPVIHIVGKDAAFRRTLAMWLRAVGYCAQSFPSAMAFVRVAAARPLGCLVVDHHPPSGIDGLALLERLPALGITIPAILIGGTGDELLARRAAAIGAFAVLRRPLTEEVIVHAVSQVALPTAA